ncbi:hypothetical protein G7B40_025230 [Aetokthonos hydrillicola Thurmond2011]|jgi:hypothetical protein|uniref:Uncharacterized protein n=1 Tax=Aetokthonos hydrillicola Thurmond2011 TaxID=2712845 RepID=A0AAP5IAG1_9CYAN|nr:hypothetical protein [Aetokthonos hydrillicola]MBO3458439.1 hypothetical protein [Aetokthonos hydrillicola CCALA 1050]MBW4586234.1 hypothetical protein [Aetokthonos hydrillicola CCALA 1050]MDR9897841.1 hypothetical protein [Aetokthonos hydrillicola Thurmond2011]
MFDSRATQLASSYQEFVENSIHNLRNIGKAIEDLLKAIQEKLKEKKEELSAIDLQVGSEKYRLVPDEECPGAWKWESAQMTDFQAQTVVRRLTCEPSIFPGVESDIGNLERDSSLAIIVYTESGASIVVYQQDQEGNCRTNIVTENLSEKEIIDLVCEVITTSEVDNKLLPPASTKAEEEELNSSAEELLTQIVVESDVKGEDKESTESPKSSLIGEVVSPREAIAFQNSDEPLPETENTPPKKRSPQESQFNVPTETDTTDPEIPTKTKKPAAEYSYEQIGDSDEVSPETKRWVREVKVPTSKAVANSRVARKRIKEENIKIAQTAVEMLKAYGEETGYGYQVYRSDAFVIKLQGEKYSIHHRRDELNQFDNPLVQFSLNSKGNPKIKIPPTQMLSVERQEFLMVGEKLESGKKLPQLANADLRDVANNLGSLAPAGTFKTLESFRETEMLGLLNSALQKANTDSLTVGEYTLTRTRDVEAGRANLFLHKTVESGERTKLLSFTLQKTAEGLTKKVDKLSINEWDIAQLKFISENAKAFDLGNTFGNSRGKQRPKESVSEMKIPLHPAIQKAWNQLETQGDYKWHSNIRQENERIRQKLQDFEGKLTIGEQRELYFQIIAQQQLNLSTEQFKMTPLEEIMKDLKQWRQEEIFNQYTPSEQIPFSAQKTAARTTAATKSKSELSL